MQMIAQRYVLRDKLGAGGMGIVYEAYDRLQNQMVALKQVTATQQNLRFSALHYVNDYHLALAQEFKTLAKLRHPHIIRVMDYGFDRQQQPFFVMELLATPQPISQAAIGLSLMDKLELLTQTTQALRYLHQQHILHRDLTPNNVMVVDDQAKVLDFDLAISLDNLQVHKDDDPGGTLRYMAPELLRGVDSSPAADFYALGMIAYEILIGQHPFANASGQALLDKILQGEIDFSPCSSDNLRALLTGLLAKNPSVRLADADVVLALLADLQGRPRTDTEPIIDSLTQHARFVGREAELSSLNAALKASAQGEGGIWLIGGESGIGKSRLVEELRIQALVSGVIVLQGQTARHQAAVYQLWVNIIRHLMLHVQPTAYEAAVIQRRVPDVNYSMETELDPLPTLEPHAEQQRLFRVIESLLRRAAQGGTYLIILEDLQWATSEDLAILNYIADGIQHQTVLVVGTYRNDDRPDLPTQVYNHQVIQLKRLTETEIARLSRAMLGTTQSAPLIAMLTRETDGNAFFIVEAIRHMARDAESLDQLADQTIPRRIFTDGIRQVIDRRLDQLSPPTYHILCYAALIERQIDLTILAQLFPQIELGAWLQACRSVLEVFEDQWRFAHDKIREHIIQAMPADALPTMHQAIATAMEAVQGEVSGSAARLAYHWQMAQFPDKAAHYYTLAGELALRRGAFYDAIGHVLDANQLAENLPSPPETQANRDRLLAEAYWGLGDFEAITYYANRALGALEYYVPQSKLGLYVALVRLSLQQARQQVFGLPQTALRHQATITRLTFLGSMTAYWHTADPVWVTYWSLLLTNTAKRTGASMDLHQGYTLLIVILGMLRLYTLADYYKSLVLQVEAALGPERAALARTSPVPYVYWIGQRDWATYAAEVRQNIAVATANSDYRRVGDQQGLLAYTYWYMCQLDTCLAACDDFEAVIDISTNRQHPAWLASIRSLVYLQQGALQAAQDAYQRIDTDTNRAEEQFGRISGLVGLALVAARQGHMERTDYYIEQVRADVSHFLTPLFAVLDIYDHFLEACLHLSEANPQRYTPPIQQARRRVMRLLSYAAGVYKAGKPLRYMWRSLDALQAGHISRGLRLAHQSIAAAQAIELPYYTARAQFMTARHMPRNIPQRVEYLQAGLVIFRDIGADWYVDQTQALLERDAHPN